MGNERIARCDYCFTPHVEIVRGCSTRAGKMCIVCESKRVTALRLEKFKERVAAENIVPYKASYAKITERQKDKQSRDKELNSEIWASRPHVCDNCGKNLPATPIKSFFSHLLTKGAHPELRFDPENIVLSCVPCHNLWEFGKNRETMATYQKHIAYMIKNGFVPKDL
jgi:5-methylcytosine-specific restriction endonuclease McrA